MAKAAGHGQPFNLRPPRPSSTLPNLSGQETAPKIVGEAAGIEPASNDLRKERRHATSVVRARFSAESVAPSSPLESPTVPWSPPQSWRHFGDGWARSRFRQQRRASPDVDRGHRRMRFRPGSLTTAEKSSHLQRLDPPVRSMSLALMLLTEEHRRLVLPHFEKMIPTILPVVLATGAPFRRCEADPTLLTGERQNLARHSSPRASDKAANGICSGCNLQIEKTKAPTEYACGATCDQSTRRQRGQQIRLERDDQSACRHAYSHATSDGGRRAAFEPRPVSLHAIPKATPHTIRITAGVGWDQPCLCPS